MKNKNLNILKCFFIMLICLNGISCGDSDDNIQPDSSAPGLDKESEAIVNKYKEKRILMGRWEYTGYGKSDFVFLSDGTCLLDGKQTTGYTVGIWDYNQGNSLLSTTCGSWSWTINLLTETQWSGISPGGNAFSYKRGYWNDPNDELLVGKWINEDSNISIEFKANNEYTITDAGTQLNGNYEVETYSPSDWNDKYKYCRYMYLTGDISGKMRVNYLDGYRLVFDSYEGASTTAPYKLTYIYSDFIN